MASTAPSDGTILDRLLPELREVLNISDIRPHLKCAHLLTDDEYEQLDIGPNNPTGEAISKLVTILKRKGPHCATMLLGALQQSVSGQSKHYGHFQVIERLKRELRAAGRMDESNRQNGVTTEVGSPFIPAVVSDRPIHTNGNHNGISRPAQISSSDLSMSGSLATSPPMEPCQLAMKHSLSKEPVPLMKYEYLNPSRHNWKEVEKLRCTLVKESKAIRRQFTDFILNVCELLESIPTATVEKVKLSLQYMGYSKNPPNRRRHHSIFGSKSSVARATSFAGLLSALHEYASWFNYDLISYIAERFGGEDGKKLVQLYESQLRKYFQRLVFQCPPFSANEQKLPRGFEELEVKVDWDFRTCSIQDVVIFKNTLSSLLDIEPSSFILKTVEEGCVQLTWAIPASVIPRTIIQTSSKAKALSKEGVLSMRLGSKVIDFPPRSPKNKTSPVTPSSHPHLSVNHNTSLGSSVSVFTEDTASLPGPVSSSLHLSSSSLIAKKSPPVVACTSIQAYGIHGTHMPPAKAKLLEYSENRRDTTACSHEDLEILDLNVSPVMVNGSYFQFYYDAEEISPISIFIPETDVDTNQNGDVFLPTPLQNGLVNPEAPPTFHHTAAPNFIAVHSRYLEEQGSPSPLSTPKFPASAASSCDRIINSPGHGVAIRMTTFQSQSSDIGGPLSPSIVSIAYIDHDDVDAIVTPVTTPEMTGNDDDNKMQQFDMDMMLSAANEARRRRGGRRRRTIVSTKPESPELTFPTANTVISQKPESPELTFPTTNTVISQKPESPELTFPTANTVISQKPESPELTFPTTNTVISQKPESPELTFPTANTVISQKPESPELTFPTANAVISQKPESLELTFPTANTVISQKPESPELTFLTANAEVHQNPESPEFTFPTANTEVPQEVESAVVEEQVSLTQPNNSEMHALAYPEPTDTQSDLQSLEVDYETTRPLYSMSQSSLEVSEFPGSYPQDSTLSSESARTGQTESLNSILESFDSPEPLDPPIWTPALRTPIPILSPPITAGSQSASSSSPRARKSVGLLWRVLGRASAKWPAGIYIAAIQSFQAVRKEEMSVRRGQVVKAMYRISNRVFAKNLKHSKGFIPYQCCRVSRKYYSSDSKIIQLSYSQLYVHSPDGIDTTQSYDSQLSIEMVIIQDRTAATKEELTVRCGDRIRVLYCDDSWVYAVKENSSTGFLPRIACRLTRKSQRLYQNWICNNAPFQADFVVKFNEPPPLALRKNIDKPTATSLTDLPNQSSKIGKIMTIVHSYAPPGVSKQITICKGLRVKVIRSSGNLFFVMTKSGTSFWIPSNYLRPACKSSDDHHEFAAIQVSSSESLAAAKVHHIPRQKKVGFSQSAGYTEHGEESFQPKSLPLQTSPFGSMKSDMTPSDSCSGATPIVFQQAHVKLAVASARSSGYVSSDSVRNSAQSPMKQQFRPAMSDSECV